MPLARRVPIDRTRHEIEQRYQEKERHEYEKLPSTLGQRSGQRGERQLFIPNNDDDYFIINTRNDWKVGQFITAETEMPSNNVGRDGEIRTLHTDAYDALVYKVDGVWYLIDANVVNDKLGIDVMLVGSAGSAPVEKMAPPTLASAGVYQT